MSIKLNGGLSVGEGSLHGLTHVKQASLGGSVGASATLAGAKWGRIKGDINDQTDLIEKFDRLHIDTTANWNAQADLIGKAGHIYVYSDYEVINGVAVPAFKVGDGLAYLIDTPFAIILIMARFILLKKKDYSGTIRSLVSYLREMMRQLYLLKIRRMANG